MHRNWFGLSSLLVLRDGSGATFIACAIIIIPFVGVVFRSNRVLNLCTCRMNACRHSITLCLHALTVCHLFKSAHLNKLIFNEFTFDLDHFCSKGFYYYIYFYIKVTYTQSVLIKVCFCCYTGK